MNGTEGGLLKEVVVLEGGPLGFLKVANVSA